VFHKSADAVCDELHLAPMLAARVGSQAYTRDIGERLRELICQEKDSWARNDLLEENS
jgi:hypothetical protein